MHEYFVRRPRDQWRLRRGKHTILPGRWRCLGPIRPRQSQAKKTKRNYLLLKHQTYANLSLGLQFDYFQRNRLVSGPDTVLWAVCVPDSCTNDDVKLSVEQILKPSFQTYNIVADIAVPPSLYTSKSTTMEYSSGIMFI